MIQPLAEMLLAAGRGGYAVIAPDFPTIATASSFLQAAEEHRAPVLLSFAPVLKSGRDVPGYRRFIQFIREEAALARVPVGLHLDHAGAIDEVREAIDLGFTSVMIDASSAPFADNVAATRQVVALAHAAGVAVESELGHVAANQAGGETGPSDAAGVLTDPDEAVRFVTETGVDALAVAIGTIHGEYHGEPRLDFERLAALHRSLSVPLVLHGSSGTGFANLERAVGLGIRKINVFSDPVKAIREAVVASVQAETFNPLELTALQEQAIRNCLEPYFVASGSQGKGVLPPPDPAGRAQALFQSGYACSEAVFLAFSEAEGFASTVGQQICSLYNGGVCKQGGPCGAYLGALAVIAARESHVEAQNKARRSAARALGTQFHQWFREQLGSTVCGELLGFDPSDPAQAGQYAARESESRVCIPMIVKTCAWLKEH